MRQCEGCEVCCTVCEVPELSKPSDKRCGHCNGGCAIYAERPPSCRSFDCYWLTSELSDSLRPDKCGVMFEKLTETILLAYASSVWDSPEIVETIQSFLNEGKAVVLKAGDARHVFVSDGRTAEGVWNEVLQVATVRGI